MKKIAFILVLAVACNSTSIAQDTLTKKSSLKNKEVDYLPQFTGGPAAWKKYLESNLDATAPKKDNAPVGDYLVRVQFTVTTDGNLRDVTPISSPLLCKACAVEATRVIEKGPKWIPATLSGKPVEYRHTQQITFRSGEKVLNYGLLPAGPPIVPFRNLPLRDALREAAAAGKIVFAQYISSACSQCNETADMAFASKELAAVIEEKCIPIKIDVQSADRIEFNKSYNPRGQIGTFFISPDSELLSHYARTTSRPSDYIAEITKAHAKQMEGRVTLKELDAQWKADPNDFTAMELNLARRQSFGWTTGVLLDQYVKRLPKDSMTSIRIKVFVAGMAPSLFTVANAWLRSDPELYQKAFGSLPEAKRGEINRQIITNSMTKAVSLKMENLAEIVADFAKNNSDKEPSVKAQQAHDKQMLYFYRGVGDTARYLQKAVEFYDGYYMSLSVKDISRKDSLTSRKAIDTAKRERIEDPYVKGRYVTRVLVSFVPEGSIISNDLVQGAESVYMLTNNRAYLQKAVSWVRTARQFYKFADQGGVLPKLLYVLGEKTEAIELQKAQLERSRELRRKTAADEATLSLMEAGQELTGRRVKSSL